MHGASCAMCKCAMFNVQICNVQCANVQCANVQICNVQCANDNVQGAMCTVHIGLRKNSPYTMFTMYTMCNMQCANVQCINDEVHNVQYAMFKCAMCNVHGASCRSAQELPLHKPDQSGHPQAAGKWGKTIIINICFPTLYTS